MFYDMHMLQIYKQSANTESIKYAEIWGGGQIMPPPPQWTQSPRNNPNGIYRD